MDREESQRSGWKILRLLVIRFRDDIGLCSTCSRWRDCDDLTETLKNRQTMISCSEYHGTKRVRRE